VKTRPKSFWIKFKWFAGLVWRKSMQVASKIILWLAFILGCFLPTSALTPSAPENRTWEIFSIGYDEAMTEGTGLGNRTETSTSDYDTAPIQSATTEEIPTEANRTLFGQNAEFKAAEGDNGRKCSNMGGRRRELESWW